MITLTLLHPVQSTPVQSWTFEHDPVIRIGRAVDNQVVLYSAVVSRYHVELRFNGLQWEVVNIGTNGTYLDGKRIQQAPLTDGSMIRLARSGPNIQVHIDLKQLEARQTIYDPDQTLSNKEESKDPPAATQVFPAPSPQISESSWASQTGGTQYQGDPSLFSAANVTVEPTPAPPCQHERAEQGALVCIDCGQPLKPSKVIGDYQVLKPLGVRGSTFAAWHKGHVVVLKTLRPKQLEHPHLIHAFQEQGLLLCGLNHPGIPKIQEVFEFEGQPFLASEMIYGQNLKQWVQEKGPLSPRQAIAWLTGVCQVLTYLHQQTPPIIHQQLNPANLIRPTVPHGFSDVVLVNLGEVQFMDLDATSTFVGAVGYTAPEQDDQQVTPAADLFSLGATLIYLMTGREPDTFYRLGDQEFRICVEKVPDINPKLAQVIQRLTHPRPDQRYDSADQVIDVFQTLELGLER